MSFFTISSTSIILLAILGYGHVTPLSDTGKLFCILYALIGIPLTLVLFTALVERLMILTNALLQLLADRYGHIYSAFHIRLIHIVILLTFLIMVVFLVPAAIFSYIEDSWNFLDAFYYCFISMATIGLGDYIPGDHTEQTHRTLYKSCITGKSTEIDVLIYLSEYNFSNKNYPPIIIILYY